VIRFAHRASTAFGAGLLIVALSAVPASAVGTSRADAARDAQWYFAPMRLDRAQQLGKDGEGVTVAVVDTGVDGTHQDLRGAVVAGRNMAGDRPSTNVDTGKHGTGMAALIAGRGHGPGRGVLGIAPRSKIMPIRPVSDHVLVAAGIRWAVEHGAKVINLSFALKLSGESLRDAIAEAVAADVVVVGAVGNGGGAVELPTSLPGVFGVGSVDRKNRVASFSNRGAGVDLVTYGTDIPLAEPGDNYVVSDGTSDSSALVAGAVALIRARYPDMSAAEVVDRLTRTAIDRGPKGRDDRYGAGQLDLVAALTAPRTPPSASPPPPAVTDAPVVASSERDTGFPPWIIVAVGVLLLIVALAGLMIVRSRRGP
jgi:type VII secretion-associated serine protease mycosin